MLLERFTYLHQDIDLPDPSLRSRHCNLVYTLPVIQLLLYCIVTMVYAVVHLGRQPKPKDLIGRSLYALGTVFRGLGSALDQVGIIVQGPYAKVDTCEFSSCMLGFWKA